MKTCFLIFLTFVLFAQTIYAQTSEKKLVKAGEDINEAFPVSSRYLYPQYTSGSVIAKDGSVANASLNYNLMQGEMQFIGPKGDTLAIANEGEIKYVVINSDSFVYDKVYLQLIATNNAASIAKNEKIKLGDIRKRGAYGTTSAGGGIDTYSTIVSSGQRQNLTEQKDYLMIKETTYYISKGYNNFMLANKKNVVKMFGQKQNEIEAYLRDNKTNFGKEDDLKRLIAFLQN